jgi:hypothetical protein
MQAVTHAGNDTIRYPPGMDNLLTPGGFKGLYLEDFVRSALFRDEVWGPFFKKPGDPDVETMFTDYGLGKSDSSLHIKIDDELDALDEHHWYFDPNSEPGTSTGVPNAITVPDSDRTQILDHYGDVPGAVLLSVCRSWSGQAISAINSHHDSNAPCLCDPPARSLATKWKNPSNWTMAYTKRFIKDSMFYKLQEYGNMCKKHNGCQESGQKWASLLNLTEAEANSVAKSMKIAWESCHHHR